MKKITIPDNWQYEEARKLFSEPEVLDSKDIAVSLLHVCLKQHEHLYAYH